MNAYYQTPQPNHVIGPDGEPIYLGPYTQYQAPYMECAHCGQPITVGQTAVPLQPVLVGVSTKGQLVMVLKHDHPQPAFVHEDCCTEYSHDHITQDECEAKLITCQYCGTKLDGDDDD